MKPNIYILWRKIPDELGSGKFGGKKQISYTFFVFVFVFMNEADALLNI